MPPLLQFKDDAAKLAGGLPSRFEGIARPEAAVALALATALHRRGWERTPTTTASADDAPWPGTTSSVEWVFGFECPDRANPFELHVSLQEATKRMLAQLRELVSLPGGRTAVGASAMMGVTASNFLRSASSTLGARRAPTLGDEGIEPGTVDAEVVDAGDGDADDSWSGVLRNAGELETMVRALLAGPVEASSAGRRGPSPGQKRRATRRKAAFGGVVAAAVAVAAVALGGRGGARKEDESKKKKK